jgi:hypothetical protein
MPASTINLEQQADMTRTEPLHPLPAPTLADQESDFTEQGAPPPGETGKARHPPGKPKMPEVPATKSVHSDAAATPIKSAVKTRVGAGIAPDLPNERDDMPTGNGAVSSEPMNQALRDIKHGLKDTDRGAEVDRTYQKLKH